jgi:putative CocE/NonD family hydrolase
VSAEIARVRYATPPLAADAAVIGPLACTLRAAIDQDDGNWIVALLDVAPDGSERELSRGYLKLSHRATDAARSTPWRPFHPHREREPVPPHAVLDYEIALAPTANVFRAGHRIALDVMSADHRFALTPPPGVSPVHLPWHICSSRETTYTLHHDGSSLLLPIVPAAPGDRAVLELEQHA